MPDATNTTADTGAKRGPKPKAPYVPVDITHPVAVMVVQTAKGMSVKPFTNPTDAVEAGKAEAAKGKEVMIFGPQTHAMRKATAPVEELAVTSGARAPAPAPAPPAGDAPAPYGAG